MAEEQTDGARGGDRRGRDRRKTDRRAPVPLWRTPWAFVAYGVLGAFVVALALGSGGDEEQAAAPPVDDVVTLAPRPAVDPSRAPAAGAPAIDAFGVAGFERLVARGNEAAGQRVRAELLCGPLRPVALSDVEQMNRSVAELADANSRVPGAECKWGSEGRATRPDVLLLVPPRMAGGFAGAPVISDDFVERRRLVAELEWLGRTEALALRTVAVLSSIE